MKKKSDIYKGALCAINGVRKNLGARPLKRLPPGVPMEIGDCPLANALSDVKGIKNIAVDGDRITFEADNLETPCGMRIQYATITVPSNAAISTFIKEFDERAETYQDDLSFEDEVDPALIFLPTKKTKKSK